jgi:hypothetical protein
MSTPENWLTNKSDFELRELARSLKNSNDVKDVEELQAVEAEQQRRRDERTDRAARIVGKVKFWFGGNLPDLFNTEKYDIEKNDDFVYIYTKKK